MIFSDSYSAMCRLRSNNYYHPVLRKVQHDLHELRLNGKAVSFCWVPGHVGIRGNERADIAAKLATLGQPELILLHFIDWIPCIREAIMTKWNGIWSARGEKMREIGPEVEKWDIDNLLNRRDEVIINRLRSGHT